MMKPYSLLWLAAILVTILFLAAVPDTVDVHLSYTYYILGRGWALGLLLLCFLLFWSLYRITARWLGSNSLSWIHVMATVIACLFITAGAMKQGSAAPPAIVCLLLILAQLLFPVNLLLGVVKRLRCK